MRNYSVSIDIISFLENNIGSSAETLDNLAITINITLQPFEHNSDIDKAFLKAVKQIIKVTTHKERYGLADVILLAKGSPSVIPKRLTMYRWQAYDTTKFPLEIKQLATKRREQRKSFSRMFTNAFQSLTETDRIKLLYDEDGYFAGHPEKKKRYVPLCTEHTTSNLFNGFKEEKYTSLPPVKKSRKRLCSSFDTLFYVGLNKTFNLKQRFLDELSPNAKRKRGMKKDDTPIDIGKIWLASTTTTRGGEKDNSQLYKNLGLLKMKLLQFHEDVRPAYYGTWSKAYNGKSIVNGRRPFAKDTQILNYDDDSEAEWDYDVDCEDIHTLDPEEDNDMLLLELTDEEDNDIVIDEYDNDETRWVVPEGYLSDDEGIHSKKIYPSMNRNHKRVTSRPVKWPISANKHFPMKSVILGPSFQSTGEPDNHPLSDFKIHMLVTLPSNALEYSPMSLFEDPQQVKDSSAVKLTSFDSITLPVHIESSTPKTPLFQREIDKIVGSYKQELIDVILDNKTKTMMGLVTVIKLKKEFSECTTAQIQTMIHDVAIQEIRDDNREYNWYLRSLPSLSS
ncbi:unnamed protein product [Mucor hiemalis]